MLRVRVCVEQTEVGLLCRSRSRIAIVLIVFVIINICRWSETNPLVMRAQGGLPLQAGRGVFAPVQLSSTHLNTRFSYLRRHEKSQLACAAMRYIVGNHAGAQANGTHSILFSV